MCRIILEVVIEEKIMLTPEKYKELFAQYGFNPVVVYGANGLSDTQAGAYHDCSDGRELAIATFNHHVLGPKTLGATPGLANYIATTEFISTQTKPKHLQNAIDAIQKIGFIAGFHDIHAHEIHCGQQLKMSSGEIRTLPRQAYTPQEAANVIGSIHGGRTDRGDNAHLEEDLIFNMIPWSTRIPDGSRQRFVFDGWVFDAMNINIKPQVLVASITETISLLSPVRDVVIMAER